MVELLRVTTRNCTVILTEQHLVIEGLGEATKAIPRSAIASVQARPVVWPRVGVGGSKLVIVHALGGERYELGEFPWRQADRLLVLLQ